MRADVVSIFHVPILILIFMVLQVVAESVQLDLCFNAVGVLASAVIAVTHVVIWGRLSERPGGLEDVAPGL
jgi:hypothetical protein